MQRNRVRTSAFHHITLGLFTILVMASSVPASPEPTPQPRDRTQTATPLEIKPGSSENISPFLLIAAALAAIPPQIPQKNQASAATSHIPELPGFHDLVFAREKDSEGYVGYWGVIVSLDADTLGIQTDSGPRMFERRSVRSVILDSKRADAKAAHWRRLIDSRWNRQPSLAIELAQNLPWVGASFRALDRLPPLVGSLVATVLILAVLGWVLLQVQDALVSKRESARLDRLKTQLEIVKTRHEALGLSSSRSEAERQALERIDIGDFDFGSQRKSTTVTDPLLPPESRQGIFGSLRWFLTRTISRDRYREEITARIAEWRTRFELGERHAARRYSRQMVAYWLGLGGLFFMGPLQFMILAVLLPYAWPQPGAPDEEFLQGLTVYSVLVYSFATYFWYRVLVERRLVRDACALVRGEWSRRIPKQTESTIQFNAST